MLITAGSMNQGSTGPITVNQGGAKSAPSHQDKPSIVQKIISAASESCPLLKKEPAGESETPQQKMRENFPAPSLFTQAGLAYLEKIQATSDLDRIAFRISNAPPGLKHALIQIAGHNLRKVTTRHPENLAHKDLRMLVAKRRVLNGEYWAAVALEQKIAHPTAVIELNREVLNRPRGPIVLNHAFPPRDAPLISALEMIVVEGAAGEEVRNGVSWRRVAEKYEITLDEAIVALQVIVVEGRAGEEVRNGVPWRRVAEKYEITLDEAIVALQVIVVEGRAWEDVCNGEPCNIAPGKYGITDPSVLYILQYMAIDEGKAGEEVRNGSHCDTVAQKWGIRDLIAIDLLQMKAVNGLAGKRVRNGEPCDTVARECGITHDEALLKLQLIAVDGLAGECVREGELCDMVARGCGITHDEALSELQLKAVDGLAGERVRNGEPWIAVASECRISHPLALECLKKMPVGQPVRMASAGGWSQWNTNPFGILFPPLRMITNAFWRLIGR